jgi:hypothetical protein
VVAATSLSDVDTPTTGVRTGSVSLSTASGDLVPRATPGFWHARSRTRHRRGYLHTMTTAPREPTSDPHIEPEAFPEDEPSRPHGDPVMPDPDAEGNTDTDTADAQPGQMPESTSTEVNG